MLGLWIVILLVCYIDVWCFVWKDKRGVCGSDCVSFGHLSACDVVFVVVTCLIYVLDVVSTVGNCYIFLVCLYFFVFMLCMTPRSILCHYSTHFRSCGY